MNFEEIKYISQRTAYTFQETRMNLNNVKYNNFDFNEIEQVQLIKSNPHTVKRCSRNSNTDKQNQRFQIELDEFHQNQTILNDIGKYINANRPK